MPKNYSRYVFFIFVFIVLLILTIPVSSATQYGSIQGKISDRYGNPIANVSVSIQDGDCKTVGSTLSKADGTFSYDKVPLEGPSGTFRLVATLDDGTTHLSEPTSFVMVYPLKSTTKDMTFYSYPSSGVGLLYGVISSDDKVIQEMPGVVYINNGMYAIYDGNKYDIWRFTLPAGDYVIWAEQNKNLTTYKSKNYTVHVVSDDNNYMPLYFTTKEQSPYHVQPVPQINVVHGQVVQKNGLPLSGATVTLGRYASNGGFEPVGTGRTNSTGHFIFNSVDVKTVSEKFAVKVSTDVAGEPIEQVSAPFTVYYANTVGKTHDYSVPVTMNIVSTGNLDIKTTPPGAMVLMDGIDTGRLTPCNISEISAGTHTLTLLLDGYYNDTFDALIQPEKTFTANRSLGISTGTISINATPGDAQIFLNGQYKGTGTVNLPKQPAGTYSFDIVRDGYQNESGIIEVIPGKQTSRNLEMVAVPAVSMTYIGYLLNNMISSLAGIF